MTEKKLLTEEDKKRMALLLLGGAGGVAGSRVFNKYVPESLGFPAVSSSIMLTSSIMPGAANPLITGVAMGRIIDYFTDKLGGKKNRKAELKERLDRKSVV